MKVLIRKVLMGFSLATVFAAPAMAEVKIGVIDYARLFDESPQAKAAMGGFQADFDARIRQLSSEREALGARYDKFRKDNASWTEDYKARIEKELREDELDLKRRGDELRDAIDARRQEARKQVDDRLIIEVREYARAQNYDIVVGDGVIYKSATVDLVDITPAVLQVLQARMVKPAGKP